MPRMKQSIYAWHKNPKHHLWLKPGCLHGAAVSRERLAKDGFSHVFFFMLSSLTATHSRTKLAAFFLCSHPSCHVVIVSGCGPLSHWHNTYINTLHVMAGRLSGWCNTIINVMLWNVMKYYKRSENHFKSDGVNTNININNASGCIKLSRRGRLWNSKWYVIK